MVGLTTIVALVAASGIGLFVLAMAAQPLPAWRWFALVVGLAGIASIPWTAWWDRRTRVVRIHYVSDPVGDKVQEAVTRLLAAFGRAHAVWSVHQENYHGDWKRNAGAGTSVGRRRLRVGWEAPPIIRTNARVGYLDVNGTRLYFFPDRLLIFGSGEVRAVSYPELRIESGVIQFVEEEGVPRDARVLWTTWRYVNKDGGPDRRFANNYQIPVVQYGTLKLSAPSGLRMSLHTSADGLAAGAEELLRLVQYAIQELESRRATDHHPAVIPSVEDDPPPLIEPTLRLLRSVLDALTLRWVSAMPGWAMPIVWGLILSLPLVALIARFAGSGGLGSDLFVCGTFVLAGGGVGSMAFELLRNRRSQREQEAAVRMSRFRALLMTELKSRPAELFDFKALVADGGLSRSEADQVAHSVFKHVANRVVADGVITPAERKKLDLLSRVLEIDAGRAAVLEGEAKSVRYQAAVSDALADGVVTDEEARVLNELQANLGLQDSPWVAGNVVQSDRPS